MTTDKPNFILVPNRLDPKYWIDKKNQLDKKTQAKMVEYIKNNSAKSLKEVIKKFLKNNYLPPRLYFLYDLFSSLFILFLCLPIFLLVLSL
ncbi:MAG: hypothetical protein H8E55_58345 [Pelagibacterales bacterium]|nr:hypothetical protein [Pelagibacterales bacterium]